MSEHEIIWKFNLLTVAEAAKRLGLSRKSLYARISRGDGPPVIPLGPRTIRIDEADLMKWIEGKKAELAEAKLRESRHRAYVSREMRLKEDGLCVKA